MSQVFDVLLVVDDEPSIIRVLSRLFKPHFEEIHVALSPPDAEEILDKIAVTHVICDQYFGCHNQSGLEILGRWRTQYPHIKRTVLFTGDDSSSILAPPGVRVMSKLCASSELLAYLKTEK